MILQILKNSTEMLFYYFQTHTLLPPLELAMH